MGGNGAKSKSATALGDTYMAMLLDRGSTPLASTIRMYKKEEEHLNAFLIHNNFFHISLDDLFEVIRLFGFYVNGWGKSIK